MSKFTIVRKIDGNITHIVIPKKNKFVGHYFVLSKYSGNIREEILMTKDNVISYFKTYIMNENKFKSASNLRSRLKNLNSNGYSDFVILEYKDGKYTELDDRSNLVFRLKTEIYSTKNPFSGYIHYKTWSSLTSKIPEKYIMVLDYYRDNLIDTSQMLSLFDANDIKRIEEIYLKARPNKRFYDKNIPKNNNRHLMNIMINTLGIKGVSICKISRSGVSTIVVFDDEDTIMRFKLRFGKTLPEIIKIGDYII